LEHATATEGRGSERPLAVVAEDRSRAGSTRLTPRGIAFIAIGVACAVGAYLSGRSELLYAAGLLLLLPLLGFLVVRLRPLRLTVARTFSPAVVSVETATVVELSVRNVSGVASAAAGWSDRIPWFPHRAGPGSLPVLSPGQSATPSRNPQLRYSLRPARRGVYDIGPLDVSYTDPFGLSIGRLTVGASQSLYVIPPVVPFAQTASLVASGEGSARLIQHLASGNDDDLMTREYRTGDALRRVHWRASARHGELMVRQEEQRSYPEARLILDTRTDGYGGATFPQDASAEGIDWFEWAVTMIASIGVHLHRSGFLVQVAETGARQIAALGDAAQGSGQETEFLLSLAGVRLNEPTDVIGGGNDDRGHAALGPVFAVVADPSPETLQWISSQRRPYETGVAFVLDTGNPTILRGLEAAGWSCIRVTATSDPARAWDRVGAVLGPSTPERR
jgi:uncharacterized protein (DUF58 family)